MKGMRVQSIIRELRGEKIDIIEFSDDSVVFATHALSPAKISRVSIIDPLGKHMEVIVDDSQLSLAIGKKGQNVRLAAKLLGWRIDIKSEEEKRQEVESAMAALVAPGAPVSVLIDYGLGEKLAEKLVESGVATVEKLGSMTPEDLEEIQGIGPKMVEKIQLAVNAYYGQFEPGGEPGMVVEGEGLAEGGEAEPAAEGMIESPQGDEIETQEASGESVETPDTVAVESDTVAVESDSDTVAVESDTVAVESDTVAVESDTVAVESDTMDDSRSSTQTPDEKGEVHES
jgi:N utilization substance protein A